MKLLDEPHVDKIMKEMSTIAGLKTFLKFRSDILKVLSETGAMTFQAIIARSQFKLQQDLVYGYVQVMLDLKEIEMDERQIITPLSK